MTFESEPGITIPALLIRSSHPGRNLPLVLYLPHRNKSWDLSGDIETLVTAGYNVVSIDVRGKGETERKDVRMGPFHDWFSFDWDVAMMALQLDKPLMTMRTLDIVKSLDFMATLDSGSLASAGIVAVAKGSACIPLLHAALIDERITGIVLEGGLVSWQRMVTDPIHRQQFDNVVPGVLTDYDLPVLTAALAPRPLVLVDFSDPMGHILDPDIVRREYELAFECYRLFDKEDHLMILERPQATPATEVYARALGRDFPSTQN